MNNMSKVLSHWRDDTKANFSRKRLYRSHAMHGLLLALTRKMTSEKAALYTVVTGTVFSIH